MPTRPTAILSLALPVLLAACASPSAIEPRLVGPTAKADGNGPGPLYVCQITDIEGTGFSDTATLRCELPEDAPLPHVTLEVYANGNSHQGSQLLEEGPLERRIFVEHFPVRITARARTSFDGEAPIVGLDTGVVRTELNIEAPGDLPMPAGPELPFDLWALNVSCDVSNGSVEIGAYTLELEGAEIERGGQRSASVDVRASSTSLRAGESEVIRVAVTHGTESVSGSARINGGDRIPFTLDRDGNYRLTGEGLVPGAAPAPEPPRNPLITCRSGDTYTECRVVTRGGIDVQSAEILVDGEPATLETDGYYHGIPQGERLFGRIRLSGIDGISESRHGLIEGALTPAGLEEVSNPSEVPAELDVLEAPFDLLHVAVNVEDGGTVIIANDTYEVPFTAPIGADMSSTGLNAAVTSDTPDLWVAVARDAEEIVADLTIIGGDGSLNEHPGVTIRSETLVATADGLAPPAPAAPTDEMVGCWVESDDLVCSVSFDSRVEAATVSVDLDGVEAERDPLRSLLPVLTNRSYPLSDVDGLGDFMPLTLEIRATITGVGEITARRRILSADGLTEATRLVIDAG